MNTTIIEQSDIPAHLMELNNSVEKLGISGVYYGKVSLLAINMFRAFFIHDSITIDNKDVIETITLDEMTVLLVIHNNSFYIVSRSESGGQLLFGKIHESDISDLHLIVENGTSKMHHKIIELNNTVFSKLKTNIEGIKSDFPFITDIVSSDKGITVHSSIALDYDKSRSLSLPIFIQQSKDLSSMCTIIIEVLVSNFEEENDIELASLYGVLQDLYLAAGTIEQLYAYLVTEQLLEYDIKSPEELSKLNEVSYDGIVVEAVTSSSEEPEISLIEDKGEN
jgi:hypothetical protein